MVEKHAQGISKADEKLYECFVTYPSVNFLHQ